jgi:hypothetical protein
MFHRPPPFLLRGRTIGLEYGLNPSENPQLLFQKEPGLENLTHAASAWPQASAIRE